MPSYFILETSVPINGNKNFRRIGSDYTISKQQVAAAAPSGVTRTFPGSREASLAAASGRSLAANRAAVLLFKKAFSLANVGACASAADGALSKLCDPVNRSIEEWVLNEERQGRPCPSAFACGGLIMMTVTTATNPMVEGAVTFRGAWYITCGFTQAAEVILRNHLNAPLARPMFHGLRDEFEPKYTDYYVWQEYGL